MAESIDVETKHMHSIDKECWQQRKKPNDELIQPLAVSTDGSGETISKSEETEQSVSSPSLDVCVKTDGLQLLQDENEKSKQNTHLNTENTAKLSSKNVKQLSQLTLAHEEKVQTGNLQTEKSTEENEFLQSNALNESVDLKLLPFKEEDSVPIALQMKENTVEIIVKQNHIPLEPSVSNVGGVSSEAYTTALISSDKIKSSDGSVAQSIHLCKERLTIDIKNTEKISSKAKVQSVTSINSQPQSRYELKKIPWYNHFVPIVTQNENGPCPLIAIANILLLRRKIVIPLQVKEVTAEELMEYVANCIMENIPKNLSGTTQLNYEQNMHDAIGVLPRLLTGLDVNIQFTGVRDFEYTPECIIFDLLNIPLYHGWLVDPQAKEVVDAVGNLGYNQLVEKIILNKCSSDSDCVTQALTAEMFLENSATQLTYHGLCELNSTMSSNELAVLFRNNHFSTIYKRKNEVFQLVTDQGFLNEPRVIWEVLCNIEGDSMFVDGKFTDSPKVPEAGPGPDVFTPLPQSISTEQQIKHDFLVALSLQQDQTTDQKVDEPWEGFEDVGSNSEVSSVDLELARCMQESYQQDAYTGPSRSPSNKHFRSPDRKKKESGCIIL